MTSLVIGFLLVQGLQGFGYAKATSNTTGKLVDKIRRQLMENNYDYFTSESEHVTSPVHQEHDLPNDALDEDQPEEINDDDNRINGNDKSKSLKYKYENNNFEVKRDQNDEDNSGTTNKVKYIEEKDRNQKHYENHGRYKSRKHNQNDVTSNTDEDQEIRRGDYKKNIIDEESSISKSNDQNIEGLKNDNNVNGHREYSETTAKENLGNTKKGKKSIDTSNYRHRNKDNDLTKDNVSGENLDDDNEYSDFEVVNSIEDSELTDKVENAESRARPEHVVSKKDLLYYVDDERLSQGRRAGGSDSSTDEETEDTTTNPIAANNTVKYKYIKVKSGNRRSGGSMQRVIQEETQTGVALLSVDGAPLPELRLPRARTQYMHELDATDAMER